MAMNNTMKMVIVGDGSIGKTCLLAAIKNPDADVTSGEYNATVAENSVETWMYEGQEKDVDVWDTAGQEAFSMLRKMAYPSSNVVVVGFCMTDKDSLNNVLNGDASWCKEITNVIDGFDSWILVGTKCDLWENWKDDDEHKANCVTMEDCYKVAEELKAKDFFVTSAKTGVNVKELQSAILKVGLGNKRGKDHPAYRRPEAPKPKPEAPKPKPEAPKPKPEAPKPDAGKPDAGKPAGKPDTGKKEEVKDKSGCCVLL
jgi:small GTP-binding protein